MSEGMGGMDIRLPMGLMFSIIGGIIAVYGVFTQHDAIYDEHSLGININLWWGLIMFAFGVIMLLLSFGKKDKSA
jgi:hypothetical protein